MTLNPVSLQGVNVYLLSDEILLTRKRVNLMNHINDINRKSVVPLTHFKLSWKLDSIVFKRVKFIKWEEKPSVATVL